MTEGKSDVIEISATVEHETQKAILIDAGLKEKVWLPKSQCEINDDGTISMKEWLAKDKGLI